MNILEALAKIPLPRLMLGTVTLIVFLFAMERFPWAQGVVEFVLNMGGSQ